MSLRQFDSPARSCCTTIASLWLLQAILAVVGHLRPPSPPSPPCSDYEMLIINTRHCVARCPIRCVNGGTVCFEDGTCPCAGNYTTSFTKGLLCAQECLTGCRSAGGFCAAPDLCLCPKKGHYFDAVARRCRRPTIFRDRCLGRCLYGTCTGLGECVCAEGYTNQTTPSPLGQLCTPTCSPGCGPRAFCHLPNMCACRKKHHHYQADGRCHHDDDPVYIG